MDRDPRELFYRNKKAEPVKMSYPGSSAMSSRKPYLLPAQEESGPVGRTSVWIFFITYAAFVDQMIQLILSVKIANDPLPGLKARE